MTERRAPRRGDVWEVDFDPVRGYQQGGQRPALIISNDDLNRSVSKLSVVVPLTTRDRFIPAHLPIEPPTGGLDRRSFVLCDQPRSLTQERFIRRRGELPEDVVLNVLQIVARFLEPMPN